MIRAIPAARVLLWKVQIFIHLSTLVTLLTTLLNLRGFFKISDNEIPVFSVAAISDINQNTARDESYATLTWTIPTATDNSGNPPTVTESHTPGQFPIGTYTVVYTAKDEADNTATLSFTITITGKCTFSQSKHP